jgi:lysophospholipase L1-like esterase
VTLVATLGDSFSCGEGVGLRTDLADTWGARVAAALDGSLVPLAAPGARIRDVRTGQLPRALWARPAVATVLAGLNDVIRSDFRPAAVQADLTAVVVRLRSAGVLVVLCRLHDPTRLLPLTPFLRRRVQDRVAVVNAAIDAAACDPGVLAVDLAAVPQLGERRAWAVDRLHPSVFGQAAMATAAASALAVAGMTVRELPAPVEAGAAGLLAEGRWFVRHAVPWLASHTRHVVLPVVSMAAGARA